MNLFGERTMRWGDRWHCWQIIRIIRQIRLMCGIPTPNLLNWTVFCWPFIWSGKVPKDIKCYTWEQVEEFDRAKIIP